MKNMKKTWLSALALLAIVTLSAPVDAAIARVNKTFGYASGSVTTVSAAAANHTAGNFLYVIVDWESSTTLSSITDTAGNTYTLLTAARTDGGPSFRVGYAYNITGNASNVVVAHFSASTSSPEIDVIQYSGIQASPDPIDGSVNNSGSTGTAVSTASITPSVTGDLLIGSAGNFNGQTFTWTTPGTEIYDGNGNGDSAAENLNAGTSSYSLSSTMSSSGAWGASMAAFKASGGTNYNLTVAHSGDSGDASLSSSPAGISCGATCVFSFSSGTVVTVSHSESTSTFTGWSGDCSGTGTCQVTMSAAKSVTANYTPAAFVGDTGPNLKACLKINSTLCPAVGSVFDFEEDSDRARFDSVGGSIAQEPDGYDVARRTGKLGYAANFAGNDNSWLRIPSMHSIGPGFWTATAWVYPDVLGSSGQKQTILANDFKVQQATHVYLENVSGSLFLKISITTSELDTQIVATSATPLTVGAWNFVTFGASSFPSISGQAVIFAQVNNSTKGTADLTYFPLGINTETYIGARVSQAAGSRTPFGGAIDQLAFFGGALNPTQVSNLHNGGVGLAYPWTDPALHTTFTMTVSGAGDVNTMSGTCGGVLSWVGGSGDPRDAACALTDPPAGITINWIKLWSLVYRSNDQYLNGAYPSNNCPTDPDSIAYFGPRVSGTFYQGSATDVTPWYVNGTGWDPDCTMYPNGLWIAQTYYTNPATGLAWTYTDLVNLQVQIHMYYGQGGTNGAVNTSNMYVEVDAQFQ